MAKLAKWKKKSSRRDGTMGQERVRADKFLDVMTPMADGPMLTHGRQGRCHSAPGRLRAPNKAKKVNAATGYRIISAARVR